MCIILATAVVQMSTVMYGLRVWFCKPHLHIHLSRRAQRLFSGRVTGMREVGSHGRRRCVWRMLVFSELLKFSLASIYVVKCNGEVNENNRRCGYCIDQGRTGHRDVRDESRWAGTEVGRSDDVGRSDKSLSVYQFCFAFIILFHSRTPCAFI